MSTSRVWAVIPARLGSRRLPGKVLADLGGRPLLQWVWAACDRAGFDRVVVATDTAEVEAAARAFGADVIRTGPAPSGTHRVAAAVGDARVAVVNVQGDQPFVRPEHLAVVRDGLAAGAPVFTLSAPYEGDPADRARVKVGTDGAGRAVGFTRDPLPGARLHVGIYGFAVGLVRHCAALPPSPRTVAEDLEQLAWLDGGVEIHVGEVDGVGPSVDTPADLTRARDMAGAGPGLVAADPSAPVGDTRSAGGGPEISLWGAGPCTRRGG